MKTVKQITGSNRPKCISQSSQPGGDGVQSASACAGCGALLLDTEVYACGSCLDLWLLADPNFDMTGESDEI